MAHASFYDCASLPERERFVYLAVFGWVSVPEHVQGLMDATLTTWTSSRFKTIHPVNLEGYYKLTTPAWSAGQQFASRGRKETKW